MTIKNIKSEFSTDQYSDTEIFDLVLSDEVIDGIKKRKKLLEDNEWLTENTNIEYTPAGIAISNSNIYGDVITVRIGIHAMLFIITDDNGQMYETESMPYEALDKQRFLLYFGDDREIYEFAPNEDDIDDFTAIYADSLNEARNILLENVALAREAHGEIEEAESIRLLKR